MALTWSAVGAGAEAGSVGVSGCSADDCGLPQADSRAAVAIRARMDGLARVIDCLLGRRLGRKLAETCPVAMGRSSVVARSSTHRLNPPAAGLGVEPSDLRGAGPL